MTGFNDHNDLVGSSIEILVDKNLRDDGIVKSLCDWPDGYLLHLEELVKIEIKRRWPNGLGDSPRQPRYDDVFFEGVEKLTREG